MTKSRTATPVSRWAGRDFSRRQLRGFGIVAMGGQVSPAAKKDTYYVHSQSSELSYKVQRHLKSKWTCECQDFKKTGHNCKHIFAIIYWLKLPSILIENSYEVAQVKIKRSFV